MSTLTIPSPFIKHGMVFISSGYPGGALRPVYAIRHGAHGDISLKPDQTSNDYIVWHQPLLGTYNTSALVYGDIYYTLLDRGFLLAHDARTGKQLYGRQRISVDSSGFTTSPWAYNGKIFLMSEDGDTFVVQAGPEYKLLGKNSLNEMPLATPAVVRGSLLVQDVFEAVSHCERGEAVTCATEARRAKVGARQGDRARGGRCSRRRRRPGAERAVHARRVDSWSRRSRPGTRQPRLRRRPRHAADLRRHQPCRAARARHLHLPRENLGHRGDGAADLRRGGLLRTRHSRHLQSRRAEAARGNQDARPSQERRGGRQQSRGRRSHVRRRLRRHLERRQAGDAGIVLPRGLCARSGGVRFDDVCGRRADGCLHLRHDPTRARRSRCTRSRRRPRPA